ncbi:MAG: LamG-like jellyroll fold domain-containing protein, partial [Planctomycetota bacterium]
EGSLGGAASLTAHAPAAAAVFDEGAIGGCLDLTAASRPGGRQGIDMSPAGTSAVFTSDKLSGIEKFSILVWSRQAPAVEGLSARLAWVDRGWDLIPIARGFSLRLELAGSGSSFAFLRSTFRDRAGFPAADDWRFTAVTVGGGTVRGYLGGLHRPPLLLSEQRYAGTLAPAWGPVTIGNFAGGIRPFKGWVGRFRIYGTALSAAEVAAVHAGDLAAAARRGPHLPPPRPEPTRPLVFKRSAIPFSTRWERPNALATMQSFHATDCLWVYGTKSDLVRAVQAAGIRYQGTLNGVQGTEKASPDLSIAGDTTGRHETFDGQKNVPPWMVTFKPPHYTGCCNQPAFRELFFAAAKQQVQIGVDMLHVDDSAMNASWVKHAAVCFCAACRAGFRDYLHRVRTPAELAALGVDSLDDFDYRQHLEAHGVPDAATYRKKFSALPLTPDFSAFQLESTRAFYRDLRAVLDAASPQKRIALSVNELVPFAAADARILHADLVDFYHGEVYDRAFATSLAGNKSAEAFGMQFVSTPVLLGPADGLRTLALAYATGQLQLVPWDIFMGSDAAGSLPRHFGTRADFGAAYDLIHDHPELFDGAASMAEVGVLVNADVATAAELQASCERLAARQVPFHLIAVATKQARIPLREADLRAIRVLVLLSPPESLAAEDRAVLDRVLADRRLRLVAPGADLDAVLAARRMDILRWEGPDRVFLFPRAAATGPIIHVVNWNSSADGMRTEAYRNVTVALRHPDRWGPLGRITYHQPGE